MPLRVIKTLQSGYEIPDPLPWTHIAGRLAAAEDALARLDERLAKSPIRDGWIARTHFTDACASLWLEGELVHLDDLVLHDAGMDIRAPTHELTRAHAVLRTRRRIAAANPDWALSAAGLAGLRGRGGQGDREAERLNRSEEEDEARGPEDEDSDADTGEAFRVAPTDDRLADVFAAVDAAIAQADRTLAGESNGRRQPQPERDPLVYDLDWDEDERLDAWRTVVDQTRNLPPTLASAIAADAWAAIEPLQHTPWLARLLGASLLRERGKARMHLPCLHEGLKAIPRERRRPADRAGRLAVQLEAIAAAAAAGLKDHDRWLTARTLLARKLDGRRSTSSLPALLDYVLTRPIVSAGMIAEELEITPRAAQDLVGKLGLREATGRGRYRAWGVV
ncbi:MULTISPECIES: RHE_PE00001 family protein [Hyphomicrobiales]|uniref:RHE_PE00001 family protein n=1 Tax=Hyphomicrobiales TaxID=356 RepID=UPI0025C70445|nr:MULTISPECIES: RHE_PE00001 family protein [Hyphomicrobiales]MCO5079701.1 RHE_PE00001 family protein [Chelatococcus sp.]MCO5153796.1 RHE_PE00001 family protein [Shinella sp.]